MPRKHILLQPSLSFQKCIVVKNKVVVIASIARRIGRAVVAPRWTSEKTKDFTALLFLCNEKESFCHQTGSDGRRRHDKMYVYHNDKD